MFNSILRAGAAAAGLERTTSMSETKEQKIAKLAVEVCQRMQTAEKESKDANETCLGLYGNFFLSILGLLESAVRLLIHFLIVLIFFFGYYIILCLSCGKAKNVGDAMRHQMSRISMYSGLLAAMLGNILLPWRPTLYLFHTPGNLARPCVPGMAQEKGLPNSLDIENCCVEACCCVCSMCGCRRGQCACCGSVPESALPPYKMAQSALFVVGCCTGCGCYQCTGGTALSSRLDELNIQVEADSRVATTAFYQRLYNVPSWDGLVASRFSGPPIQQGQQHHQQHQQMHQQQYLPQQQQMHQQHPPQQQQMHQQYPPQQQQMQHSVPVHYGQTATPVVVATPVISKM